MKNAAHYWLLILKNAFQESWGAVVVFEAAEIIRNAAIVIIAFVIAYFFGPALVRGKLMSNDNTQDTLAWTIIVVIAVASIFLIVFLVHLLFITPYKMWQKATDAKTEPTLPDDGRQESSLIENLSAENTSLKITIAALKEELENTLEFRRAASKIITLKEAADRLLERLEKYDEVAGRLKRQFETGNFDPKVGMPNEFWYRGVKWTIDELDGMRRGIREIMTEHLGQDFDFDANPKLERNPFSIHPPYIDKLPLEEFKHEYRRAWERLLRAQPVIEGLPKKFRDAIAEEERKITGSK